MDYLIPPTFIPFKPFFICFLFHIFRLDSLLDRWTCERLLYIYTYMSYTLLDPYHFTVKTLYLGLPITPDFCLSIPLQFVTPLCRFLVPNISVSCPLLSPFLYVRVLFSP
ncbi:hypothetical protein V8E53_006143 [Lactarius tabidus]